MEYVRVYELNENGMHDGYQLIEGSVQNIANYIASKPNRISCIITDTMTLF